MAKPLTYRKFIVKDGSSSADSKWKAKVDSGTPLSKMADTYGSVRIALAPGKSKAVSKKVIAKKSGKTSLVDKVRATPDKTNIYVGGEPIAYQG